MAKQKPDLGAMRAQQLANYRANADVVMGWQWSAAPDACEECRRKHGGVHPLSEDMQTHEGCRCTPLPVTRSYDSILGDLGSATERHRKRR